MTMTINTHLCNAKKKTCKIFHFIPFLPFRLNSIAFLTFDSIHYTIDSVLQSVSSYLTLLYYVL